VASARARAAVARDKAPVEAAKTDLDKPDVQFEILNPKTLGYTLSTEREITVERIVEGKKTRETTVETLVRKISIPKEFTIRDISVRRILDDVEAFRQLYFLELRRVSPSEARTDPAFYASNMPYLEVAMKLSAVRSNLRELVASMATFEDGSHPTSAEIAEGMDNGSLSELGFYILFNVGDLLGKKATAGT